MYRVLFLDIATKTGWAQDHDHDPGRPSWGSEVLEGEPEQYGKKAVALETFLERRIAHQRPNMIGFEKPADPQFFSRGPDQGQLTSICQMIRAHDVAGAISMIERLWKPQRFTNFATIRTLIILAGIAELVAERNGIQCVEVPVQSWRAYFTGTQAGGKEPAFNRCQKLGWNVSGFDESDAVGGWCFVKSKIDPKFALPVDDTPLFGARP